MNLTFTFDANYGRDGIIEVRHAAECHGCGRTAMCLVIDPSEREYTPGAVCSDCIQKLFAAALKTE